MSNIRRWFAACAALAAAFAAQPLFADTWTDPDTGYTWTYKIKGDDTAEIYKGNYQAAVSPAPTGHLEIPAELGGKPVARIGDYALYCLNGLAGVTIPDSVTSIGKYAFYNCSKLKSVLIPCYVESIGEYSFGFCGALTAVVFTGDEPSMGKCVFDNDSCTVYASEYAYWSVDIPGQWQGLDIRYREGTEVFGYTWHYRVIGETVELYGYDGAIEPDPAGDLVIPATLGGKPVSEIGEWAFHGCANITSATIPDGVTRIGDFAFYYCDGLTSVTIPSSVKSIGESAFSECSGLKSVTILNGLTSIGYSAFYECSGLKSVTIPSSVKDIGDFAFYYCTGLESATIGNGVTNVGESAFAFCHGLTSLTIQNGVKSIGYSAFYGCSALTSVTIPDSVTSIGDWVFGDCSSLTEISLPSAFKGKIDEETVFSGCPEGMKIVYRSSGDGTWTVKYHKNDPNGGADVTKSQSFAVGETKRLLYLDSALKWSTKDEDGFSYIFLGWAKSKTGAAFYSNGEQVCDLAAKGKVMHLYAVWQKRAYDVVFHCNDGGSRTGTQEFRPGIAKNLLWLDSGLGWTRTGYEFLGWAKSPTGGIAYKNGASVKDIAAQGEKLHLYGKWRERTYDVCFHSNDWRNFNEVQKIRLGLSWSLLWLDSGLGWTRTGFDFLGWAKSPSGDVVYANGAAVKNLAAEGKTMHLYAVWRERKWFVCFHSNYGTGMTADQTISAGATERLYWVDSQLGWSRSGYWFRGWAKSPTGGVAYTNGQEVRDLVAIGKTLHLYGVWGKKTK